MGDTLYGWKRRCIPRETLFFRCPSPSAYTKLLSTNGGEKEVILHEKDMRIDGQVESIATRRGRGVHGSGGGRKKWVSRKGNNNVAKNASHESHHVRRQKQNEEQENPDTHLLLPSSPSPSSSPSPPSV
jgi:hypothetical protein